MIDQSCAICKKNNFEIIYEANFDVKKVNEKTFSARRLPDQVHFRFVRCRICKLLFSTPILDQKIIEKLYQKSFVSYDEHIDNLNETYGYYLSQLEKYNVKKNNLLEIGCGNGFFLKEAKRQGYKNVYGVEPGKKSVDKALPDIKKNITIDIFREGQFKADFFDVITCFQTFDHIPDPNSFLKESYRILKKDGIILFLNHDEGAILNRVLGERSPIIDIEHMYLFNKKTIKKIFKKHNFKVMAVESVFNIHALAYWVRLFPLPTPAKKLIIQVFETFRLVQLKIKIYPGNLVIYAKK